MRCLLTLACAFHALCLSLAGPTFWTGVAYMYELHARGLPDLDDPPSMQAGYIIEFSVD